MQNQVGPQLRNPDEEAEDYQEDIQSQEDLGNNRFDYIKFQPKKEKKVKNKQDEIGNMKRTRWTSIKEEQFKVIKHIAATKKEIKTIRTDKHVVDYFKLYRSDYKKVINQEFNIDTQTQNKYQLEIVSCVTACMMTQMKLIQGMLNIQTQDEYIQRAQLMMKEITSETIISLVESMLIEMKKPTIQLESTIKQTQNAMKIIKQVLNRKNQQEERKGPKQVPIQQDIVMDDDFELIDLLREELQGQVEELERKEKRDEQEILRIQKCQVKLQQVQRILEDSQQTIQQYEQTIAQKIQQQVVDIRQQRKEEEKKKEEEEKLLPEWERSRKMSDVDKIHRWLYAWLQYKKYWPDLDSKEKEDFEMEQVQYIGKDVNILKEGPQGKEVQLYVDFNRHQWEGFMNSIHLNLKNYMIGKGHLQYQKIKSTIKVELSFKKAYVAQVFKRDWQQMKLINKFMWRGVTRWKPQKKKKPPKDRLFKKIGRPNQLKP